MYYGNYRETDLSSSTIGRLNVTQLSQIVNELFQRRHEGNFANVRLQYHKDDEYTVLHHSILFTHQKDGYVWRYDFVKSLIKMIINDFREYPVDCDCQYHTTYGCEVCCEVHR